MVMLWLFPQKAILCLLLRLHEFYKFFFFPREKEKSGILLPLEIHQSPKPKYFTLSVSGLSWNFYVLKDSFMILSK